MTQAPPPSSETDRTWRPFLAGVRAFVARRVPVQDADDVAQDVLLRLHQQTGALRDGERAAAWVYGIARRTVADYYRARRPLAELGEDDQNPVAITEPENPGFASFPGRHSVHEEVLSWLRPMVDELPAGYREALLLADFEGRPQKEVATALGLSLSGAKSRIQRARALLGENLHRCCTVELGADGRVVDFERRRCEC